MTKNNIRHIIDTIYPKIQTYYGTNKNPAPKVEIHNNIYERLSGIKKINGEETPYAEFSKEENKIFLYTPKLKTKEQIIKSLIHEYTHSLQDAKWHKRYYNEGYNYSNHPYEIAAHKNENDWRIFC